MKKSIINSIKEKVKEHGYTFIGVAADPQFAYSVGGTLAGGVDVIVFGLPNEFAETILTDLMEAITSGDIVVPPEGCIISDIASLPFMLMPCDIDKSYEDTYYVASHQYHTSNVVDLEDTPHRIYQAVLPDRAGKLPWDDGFDYDLMRHQPVLYTVNAKPTLH